MDQLKLNEYVENYLNENSTNHFWEDQNKMDLANSFDRFILCSAKRLCYSYDLFKSKSCSINDLMIALRDYLLTLGTSLKLKTIPIPLENDNGISLNESGSYQAFYQLPKYVNSLFTKDAFLYAYHEPKVSDRGYDLHTDPLIWEITGFEFFKSPAQKLAVYGALNTPEGYSTLVSLPTGGGKSLITQTLAYQKDGLTVIIVPTVSLAIDQVRAAKAILKTERKNEEVFSYHSGSDAGPILKAIRNKTARMLFISPEALLNNTLFENVISEANATHYLKNIIIDEAHIVVDWGASFRVDYQCLESWRRKLLKSNPLIRTILLSATFEQHCISVLKDFFSEKENWIEIRCDSLRHEPRFMLIKASSNRDKSRKMIELVHKMPHPMIIYVARPVDAEQIVSLLKNDGIKNVRSFTGLTTGQKRREIIDSWVNDEFEIMVATSAFGVGVDKADVRTVLHMYIPQNPNAYYQELGRGGRDRLPCLSIMCVLPDDDLSQSFSRISKKVMTTEKIIGRWNSMFNSPTAKKIKNLNYLDSSIKPSYATLDSLDDSPASETDMNWNIYVILFLRRYGLIKIHEVLPQRDKYIFVIEIINDALRLKDKKQEALIEQCRAAEWSYYEDSFKAMRNAIIKQNDACWSEMFFETYDKVSEYCAGCNAHSKPNESDFMDYPLKASVEKPIKCLAQDQLALFGGASSIIVFPAQEEYGNLMAALCSLRMSAFVTMGGGNFDSAILRTPKVNGIMILNGYDLRELIKKHGYYYLSGIVGIKYGGTPRDIYESLKYVLATLSQHPGIKIVHILDENVRFDWLDKAFADLVDGTVLPANAFTA